MGIVPQCLLDAINLILLQHSIMAAPRDHTVPLLLSNTSVLLECMEFQMHIIAMKQLPVTLWLKVAIKISLALRNIMGVLQEAIAQIHLKHHYFVSLVHIEKKDIIAQMVFHATLLLKVVIKINMEQKIIMAAQQDIIAQIQHNRPKFVSQAPIEERDIIALMLSHVTWFPKVVIRISQGQLTISDALRATTARAHHKNLSNAHLVLTEQEVIIVLMDLAVTQSQRDVSNL
jgi:hypothetical protein